MTETAIKKEIYNFIKKFSPIRLPSIIIEDDRGLNKYDCLYIEEQEDLAEHIYEDIENFATNNGGRDCQLTEGLWEFCKKDKSFGDICTLYYEDEKGNFIKFLSD